LPRQADAAEERKMTLAASHASVPPMRTPAKGSAEGGADGGPVSGAARAIAPPFVLPGLVRAVVSRLPAGPPSWACALALTFAAPRLIGREGVAELEGKAFRIAVRDAGASVAFRVRAPRFEPLAAGAPVDVSFTACAADFLLLATRRVDPDTLFFERRLAIEGDTEAGLLLKNLLDAVEIPRWLRGD
jgi:predicted lipid carrier protein YhbT